MPGKSKKIQGARRGILKLTTAEKRLHETFGEDAAWTNENYDPKTIAARLETTVRVTIRGLEKQLGLLKLADPALLARAVEVFESEECAATWLVTVQHFLKIRRRYN